MPEPSAERKPSQPLRLGRGLGSLLSGNAGDPGSNDPAAKAPHPALVAGQAPGQDAVQNHVSLRLAMNTGPHGEVNAQAVEAAAQRLEQPHMQAPTVPTTTSASRPQIPQLVPYIIAGVLALAMLVVVVIAIVVTSGKNEIITDLENRTARMSRELSAAEADVASASAENQRLRAKIAEAEVALRQAAETFERMNAAAASRTPSRSGAGQTGRTSRTRR